MGRQVTPITSLTNLSHSITKGYNIAKQTWNYRSCLRAETHHIGLSTASACTKWLLCFPIHITCYFLKCEHKMAVLIKKTVTAF